MKSFNSISQFRHIVDAMEYNNLQELEFNGTIKLHGTNIGISYQDGLVIHTRSGVLEEEFYGIHDFVNEHEVILLKLLNQVQEKAYSLLRERLKQELKDHLKKNHLKKNLTESPEDKLNIAGLETLVDSIIDTNFKEGVLFPMLHGEYIGPGINKGAAVQKLNERRYVIFNTSINTLCSDENILKLLRTNKNDSIAREYLSHEYLNKFGASSLGKIDLISDFEQFNVLIDLNDLDNTMNELRNITIEVENECPYGKAFGISGIGEGIVWVANHPELKNQTRYWFKTKGQKHKKNKAHKPKFILSASELESVNDILEEVLPGWRLEQFLPEDPKMEQLGKYLKDINEDIKKECSDILSGLDQNMLNTVKRSIQDEAKGYFLKFVNELSIL